MWILVAILSAVFAGLTAILAKCGIRKTNSGLATGASWLCYYYAIQNGDLSVVIPIDKMSILLTVLFSRIFLKEKLSKKSVIGLVVMCAGTLAMAIWA